jgi:oxygen-independent coproporphyrinogen-3 oxidase
MLSSHREARDEGGHGGRCAGEGAIDAETLRKYAAPVPRYTSYPTAAHFNAGIDHAVYADWLSALPGASKLSLYVHIPFCDTLCWFCGCTTKAVQRYAPVASYLPLLYTEIAQVADRLGDSHRVAHLHWGGGSPNILNAADIEALAERLTTAFPLQKNAEFAVEIDPRGLTVEQVDAFVRSGVNRVSIGVQDFSDEVQAAINRMQSFETTKYAVDLFRERGVESINIDLVYGLPHQTLARLDDTLAQVISLHPDRIAVFGYAHLPSRIKHQRQIDNAALPGLAERYASANLAARRLTEAGFVRVGFDHFARPRDALAAGRIHRNFQGYTTDSADALLGFGPSAIGRLPQGYVQNAVPIADYLRRIGEHGLAAVRGYAFTHDDVMRHFTIERLMCDLAFPAAELRERFGADAAPILAQADALVADDRDGFVEPNGDGFQITERGRMFVRTICAHFDAHDRPGGAQYSSGA